MVLSLLEDETIVEMKEITTHLLLTGASLLGIFISAF